MHKVHVIFASIFVIITIPLVILLYQAYSQLQLGTNSLYTGHAMFVANTLNQRLAREKNVPTPNTDLSGQCRSSAAKKTHSPNW